MCPPHPFSHFPTSGHPCGPAFLPTWPLHSLHTTSCTLLCTSAHLCAPSRPPAHLCASPFLGLSPLSDFPLTSDPLPATMGNPALVQPGTAPILDLCITKSNPCGPHAAHLPSLWACTTHIAIQGSGLAGSPVTKVALLFMVVSPAAGSHTSLSHGPWVGKFFLLGKTLTVIPRGLQGLSPKGGIGVLGYIRPTTFSTSAPIHHHGDTFHFHLLVCAAWGSIPTSQGLVPVQGSILTNLGFCPHPRFCPHHPWSMTTLSLPLGGLLVGVVSMRGKGHWLRVVASVRVY